MRPLRLFRGGRYFFADRTGVFPPVGTEANPRTGGKLYDRLAERTNTNIALTGRQLCENRRATRNFG